MNDKLTWENHPDYETIKKYANYIDKTLEKEADLKLNKYIQTVKKICEQYHYLEEKKFIEALPFFDKRPKGIGEGVSISLASYAIRDYLISYIEQNLSYILESQSSEVDKMEATRELIEVLKQYFKDHVFFKELNLILKSTDETLGQIKQSGFSYEGICEAFGSKPK